MRLIYIAGAYRGPTPWATEQNVRRAEAVGMEVARLGGFPVIPHANTRPYFAGERPDGFWLDGTRRLMDRCDGVVLLVGWEASEWAVAEHERAKMHGTPVFHEREVVESQTDKGTDFVAWLRHG